MYKSKLQNLCQLRQWPLPVYQTPLKTGPDHNPSFTATVTVNGEPYTTVEPEHNSKSAQNTAAKIAFDTLSGIVHVAPEVVHVSPDSVHVAPEVVHVAPEVVHVAHSTDVYKSKLHSLCQLRQWPLPVYSMPLKTGPAHNPSFTATVTVNGAPCTTTEPDCNSKAAQNSAAKLAFNTISGNLPVAPPVVHVASSPGPTPVTTLPTGLIGGSSTLMNGCPTEVTSKKFVDSAHVYKNRLQNYAVKRNLPIPVYSWEREGPPHAPRFRCKVTFQGITSDVSEFYSTIKEAEHAAAKNAWESWSLDEVQQDDTALYKNLLQEYLQKKGCPVPKYETTISGPSHMPNFVSKVIIKGQVFEGQATSSKKRAESHVAKVAYLGLQDPSTSNMTEELNEAGNSNLCIGQKIETQPEELNQAGDTMVCIGQPIDTRSGFNSGYRINDALELSSSLLQSIIAKADDLPLKSTPYANLLIPAETEISEECVANTDEAPPTSLETNIGAKRVCLPSSDLLDFNSSTYSSVESSNNVHQQAGSTHIITTTNETIVVRPCVPNMTYPAGVCIFPFSDEKWVAVKMNSIQ